MTFPVAELKFSQIVRALVDAPCLVRLYRVDDGGFVEGQQQYLRTLKRQRRITIDASWTDEQIVTRAREKLTEWAFEEFGFVLPPDRLLCDL